MKNKKVCLTIEHDRVLKKGDKVLVFFKNVQSMHREKAGTCLVYHGHSFVVQEPLEAIYGATVVGDSNPEPE